MTDKETQLVTAPTSYAGFVQAATLFFQRYKFIF